MILLNNATGPLPPLLHLILSTKTLPSCLYISTGKFKFQLKVLNSELCAMIFESDPEEESDLLVNNQKDSESRTTYENAEKSSHRDDYVGEWLSLGLHSSSNSNDASTRDIVDHIPYKHEADKVFSCNFCLRKFYSSQALGGHQNAHKKERRETIKHISQGALVASQPFVSRARRFLGVQPHSFVQKLNREGNTAKFRDYTGFGLGWRASLFEKVDKWPGSFHMDKALDVNSNKLDLNLQL